MHEKGHGRTGPTDLTESLGRLQPHDHLSLIYDSPEEWRAAVVPFIRMGLERGEKCMYIVDTRTADEVRRYLADAGVDVPAASRSGRLSFLQASEACTQGGTFDPDRLIALLIEETQRAVAEGYPALRITGEMTWVLRGAPGSERLLEYEAKLNRDLFPHHPCLSLCQHDRWAFDPEVIKGVLMTHPKLIRGGQLHHNFYYTSPEEFLDARHADREVEHWLNSLDRERKTWEQMRENEERYQLLFENVADAVCVHEVSLEGPGRFLEVNEHACQMLGFARDELLQMTVGEIGVPEQRQQLPDILRQLYDNVAMTFETELQAKDGRRVPLEVSTRMFNLRDTPVVLSVMRDITRRKKAEEALRDSEARHRQLFEESPVALREQDFSAVKQEMDALRASGVTDLGAYFDEHPDVVRAWIKKVRVLRTNHAAQELFLTSDDEEMLALLLREAAGPLEDVFRSEFIDLFSGDTGRSYRGQQQDLRGNTLETLVRLVVVPGHEEQLDRVLVSIEDVTAQVRAQQEVERSYRQVRKTFEGTVDSLSALSEARDPYTVGHQQGVARLACAIAKRMGMAEGRIEGLRVAALLHDIGKNSVPAEILSKPTRLSELEFSMIKEHPRIGSDILQGIDFPWPVAEITLQHHERLDGSGYPQALKRADILLEAQILAVADVVEAMAAHRPYRPALGVDAALAEIRDGAGTRFNKDAVAACLELFAEGFALDDTG